MYGNADSPALIIVPGSLSDAHEWRNVASAITAWPSVVVVNRRGRAPSGPQTDTYSLQPEVEDLKVVLDNFSGTTALFGWSYGGLIVLLAANELSMRQIIAYEPVMKPFGEHALPALEAATERQIGIAASRLHFDRSPVFRLGRLITYALILKYGTNCAGSVCPAMPNCQR